MVAVDAAVHDADDDVTVAGRIVLPDRDDIDVAAERFSIGSPVIVEVPLLAEFRIIEGEAGRSGCRRRADVGYRLIVCLVRDRPVFNFQHAGKVFQRNGGFGQRRRSVEPNLVPAVQTCFVGALFKFPGIREGPFHPDFAQHRCRLGRNQGVW